MSGTGAAVIGAYIALPDEGFNILFYSVAFHCASFQSSVTLFEEEPSSKSRQLGIVSAELRKKGYSDLRFF